MSHEVGLHAGARVALSSMVLLGTLGLAGCSSVDELKGTVSGWFAPGKVSRADEGMFVRDADGSHPIPPERIVREGKSKASKNENQAVRGRQPKAVTLEKEPAVSAPTDRVPDADRQATSSTTAPSRLRTLWPEPPAPGTFSR
jgi:hypothetical protein